VSDERKRAEVVPLDREHAKERHASCLGETTREMEGWVQYLVSACATLAINGVWSHRRKEFLMFRGPGMPPTVFGDCPDPKVRVLADLAVTVERTLERLTGDSGAKK
jgi:hypothetical protein